MTTQERTPILSKIKRVHENVKIHYLFVFNKAGICLYSINITSNYSLKQYNLISSYFTALMAFTNELIGNKIKTMEMGNDVKLVIIEKDLLYYGLLCDSAENLIFLEDLISKVHFKIIEHFKTNKISLEFEQINDEDLDKKIVNLIEETLSSEFDLNKEEKIVKYLKDALLDSDIKGIILLTNKGKLIYSSLKNVNINNFLKEIDFRVKICNNSILRLFYTSKNNDLILSEIVSESYLLILVFDIKVKFGLAEFYLNKAVKFIKSTLSL